MDSTQKWIDLYRPFLVGGALWRSDADSSRLCQVIEVNPRRVKAFYLRFTEDGERLTRSHRDTFLCTTGIFLREFSPADQIIGARPASIENTRAVLAAKREAVSLCKQAVKQRLEAIASALQGERAELVQRISEILDTEIDHQVNLAMHQWQPPEPRLVGKPDSPREDI